MAGRDRPIRFSASSLKIRSLSVVTNDLYSGPLIHLEWQAVPGANYAIEGAKNVADPFVDLDILGTDSTNAIWEMQIEGLGDGDPMS